ncbi:hypothetical protein ACFFRR_008495 [Megaselia abdita]
MHHKISSILLLFLPFLITSTQVSRPFLKDLKVNGSKESFNATAANEKLNTTYSVVPDWPDGSVKLGSVSAVTLDVDGNVVVFHRDDRLWTANTFDMSNVYREQFKGAIKGFTVLALDKASGRVVYKWGRNLFYMPHGLTIDHENNAWATDVALHQVMKFGPKGSSDKPLMVLGSKFLPGQGNKFCKPTSVAVLKNGDFFVADGYCNARIIKFNKAGEQILQWGEHSFMGHSFPVAPRNHFAIPHALTLLQDKNIVCAADRENGRIQCFTALNGTFVGQFHSQTIGDRLFSMAYSPASNGQFFIVNGPDSPNTPVSGYVMDYKSKNVLSRFGAQNFQFSNPHDVAVSEDAEEVYVVELDPYKVYKFVKSKTDKSGRIPVKPTVTSVDDKDLPSAAKTTRSDRKKGSLALLVVVLVVLFGVLTLAMTLLISRRRRRGNDSKDKLSQGIEYNKLVAGDDDFE